MVRITIKKVEDGYAVTQFRKTLDGRKTVKDDLGTYSTKREAVRQAKVSRQLAED